MYNMTAAGSRIYASTKSLAEKGTKVVQPWIKPRKMLAAKLKIGPHGKRRDLYGNSLTDLPYKAQAFLNLRWVKDMIPQTIKTPTPERFTI